MEGYQQGSGRGRDRGKSEGYESEIKENVQGANSEGKKQTNWDSDQQFGLEGRNKH